jgi:hypothetical protein
MFAHLLGQTTGGARAGLNTPRGAPTAITPPAAGSIVLFPGNENSHGVNNTQATTDQGEPNHCGIIGAATVWLKLNVRHDGLCLINTTNSEIATVVAVYRNLTLAGLQTSLVACGTNSVRSSEENWLRFPVQAEETYTIVADGYKGSRGRISVNSVLWVPPQGQGLQQYQGGLGEAVALRVIDQEANPAPSYRWWRNGRPLEQARGDALSIERMQWEDAGRYSVVASNRVGMVTNTIELSLDIPVFVEKSITLHAPVSESGPYDYQWWRNGERIEGGTTAIWTIARMGSADEGRYEVEVWNGAEPVKYPVGVLVLTYPYLRAVSLIKDRPDSPLRFVYWLTGTSDSLVLEASADLKTWTPQQIITPLEPVQLVDDTVATAPMRFFRARPNQAPEP